MISSDVGQRDAKDGLAKLFQHPKSLGEDMRLNLPCVVLLLLVLTSGHGRARDGEVITITGRHSTHTQGEDRDILTPCDALEIWDVATDRMAFAALAQVYAGLDTTQMSKYGQIFVELRGRYTASGEESHKDGIFAIIAFVRHSMAVGDLIAWSANTPVSPDRVDGRCGNSCNRCVAGRPFDHEEGDTADTSAHDRWGCLGSYGGDISEVCTAPKAGLREAES